MPDVTYRFVAPSVDLSTKGKGKSPKEYNTKRSKLSRITAEAKRIKYLGFRDDVMCKYIVSRY